MADRDQFISGWLHKRGGQDASKAWRKRWCVLRDQALHYYKSEQDKEPTGSVYAEDVVGISRNDDESSKDPKFAHVFEVYTNDRTFVFCASSGEEREEWMDQMKRMLSRDERMDQGAWQGQMLEFATIEVFIEKGLRVNGPLAQDTLAQLGQGANSKQKRMDERGWYCDIFVSMHRVLEVMNGHGWRLDQLFHTNALLPSGVTPCNVLVFCRNMSFGARPPSMHFALENVEDDGFLVRGYTSAGQQSNKDIVIGSEGEIIRSSTASSAVKVASPTTEG